MKQSGDRRLETGVWAYVALGSNLGDPCKNILAAVERLRVFSEHPLRVSSLWESEPVDCPPGSPRFVNAMVGFRPRPGLTPELLLEALQEIERHFGRQPRVVVNEPRPLDLDLVAFGDQTRSTPLLKLPHPRAHLRGFVLSPLSELAPDLVLPGQKLSVRELLRGTSDASAAKRTRPS